MPDPTRLPDANFETHDLHSDVWAVFTGCDGEDPRLAALFFREDDARAYCAAKHPDPEEDGRALAFNATWTPARIPPVTLTYANDYRVYTREEFNASAPRVGLARGPFTAHCSSCGRDWIILATVSADHEPPSEVMAAHDCDGVGVLASAHRRDDGAYDVRAVDTESSEATVLDLDGGADGSAPVLVRTEMQRLRDIEAAARAYHAAERARTRNEDPAAEERLDEAMAGARTALCDALDLGDDCEACGAGDNEGCAEGCPCQEARATEQFGDQCDACAGGTGDYEGVARG